MTQEPSGPSAVTLDRVVKRYGPRLALDAITLEIPRGAVCALVGPNGSGKTTTMGVIAGLLHYESGRVDVLGRGPFAAPSHAGLVSVMPQDAVPSQHLAIADILRYYAELQGLGASTATQEAQRRLEQVHLADRGRARYGELSHGMRRRFSVAQALLGHPELVLLDEPTSGLDPELVVQIREIIASLAGNATVLVSSHVLSELEAMCDHAIFIDAGRVVHQGRMDQLKAASRLVRYTLTSMPDLRALELGLEGAAVSWAAPILSVVAPQSQSVERTNELCLSALLHQQVGILRVDPGQALEQTYLELKRKA